MTSHGFEHPAAPVPVDAQAATAEGEHGDWDDPLTRLLLLLEIADRPDWLRQVARTAQRGGWSGRPGS